MDTLSVIAVAGAMVIAAIAAFGGVIALLTQKVIVDQAAQVTDIESLCLENLGPTIRRSQHWFLAFSWLTVFFIK